MSTPQNQPIPTPENKPGQGQNISETQPQGTPEASPAPVSPEKPAAETFADQQAVAPAQPQPDSPVVAQATTQPPKTKPKIQSDEQPVGGIDQAWVNAVEHIIEKDKNKPYEEEEDSEVLQQKYLHQRFGKDISKEDDKRL